MSNRTIPYTADELHEIANQVDDIIDNLSDTALVSDGDWRWGVTVDVMHQGESVGVVKLTSDGWFGFYPREASW